MERNSDKGKEVDKTAP